MNKTKNLIKGKTLKEYILRNIFIGGYKSLI